MNYYSYSPLHGMQYWPTKDGAVTAADNALKTADPATYGLISWGEVCKRAVHAADGGYGMVRQELLSYESAHPELIDAGGRMLNPVGDYVHPKNIKPQDLLIHEIVQMIAIVGSSLSGKLRRYRGYSIMEALALADLLFEMHGVKRGGSEGNMEFRTFDGQFKLQICILKTIEFGPEIQIARQKMIQALEYYPADADDLKNMVAAAYSQIDGKIRVAEILKLRKINITNEAARVVWAAALDLIAEAMVVSTSKKHLRIYVLNDQGGYDQIPLNIAAL